MLTILFCLFLILFLYEFVRFRQFIYKVKSGELNGSYRPSALYVAIIGIITDSLIHIDKVIGD